MRRDRPGDPDLEIPKHATTAAAFRVPRQQRAAEITIVEVGVTGAQPSCEYA